MVVTPVSPPSPALPTSTRPTSLDHELRLEALPDTPLDETHAPGPNTPEKEKESDCVTEERPSTSSPVQFIGINYVPPDVQTTSQPRPQDPTPWDSGAASLLSEEYVVIGLPTFPPKPCVVFPVSFYTYPSPIHFRLTLEHSNGQAKRGGVPVSSYRFGPAHDSAYSGPPMGRIGVHHPREIVRVERDYTGGEIVQFSSAFPMELEGRVSLPGLYHAMRHADISFYIHADHAQAVHGKYQRH
jgi:hypothetical protein